MKWDDVGASACPVARATAVIGDRWTLLIVREALLGARRFSDFERQLELSPFLLSTRLARLIDSGVIARVDDGYRLTPAGRDLQPVIVMLSAWGDRWRPGPASPDVRQRHANCGCAFTPTLACSECGEAVGARELKTEFGPALTAERAARAATHPARDRLRPGPRRPVSTQSAQDQDP